MKQEVTVELAGGKRLHFETGRMAKQASGAALVSSGDTVVLATAVASPDPREGIDFFPLTVDYREYAYAGGRIPGATKRRSSHWSSRRTGKTIRTSSALTRRERRWRCQTFRSARRLARCA